MTARKIKSTVSVNGFTVNCEHIGGEINVQVLDLRNRAVATAPMSGITRSEIADLMEAIKRACYDR